MCRTNISGSHINGPLFTPWTSLHFNGWDTIYDGEVDNLSSKLMNLNVILNSLYQRMYDDIYKVRIYGMVHAIANE